MPNSPGSVDKSASPSAPQLAKNKPAVKFLSDFFCSISLVCRVRSGVFEILDHRTKINGVSIELVRRLISKTMEDCQISNLTGNDEGLRQFFEVTLSSELPKLLNLPDHKVKIDRSHEKDGWDEAITVRIIPQLEGGEKKSVQDGGED
ncbi:MAG: hypothetical protein WCV72_01065 [Patescibacteria group bacterium]